MSDRILKGRPARPWLPLLMLILTFGCSDSPSRPGSVSGDLLLTIEASALRVPVDASLTLTGRLTNTGDETLELTFPDSCVIGLVIQTASGTDATPGEVCLPVVTDVVLAPGASYVRPFTVSTGTTDAPGRLMPGQYRAFVQVDDHRELQLQSRLLLFTVE